MKPPDIIVLTPNGRFTVGKKICLSISGFHPETWQPSWSIRTALLAIIGFMPTPGHGTIGSLDYTPEERKVLAQRSVSFACEECGVASQLLAPPSGEAPSPARDQELRDILHSMALKSEEEILEEKSNVGLTPSPSTSADFQQTAGQAPVASAAEPAAARPAAVAAAAVVSASSSSGVGQSRPSTSAVYRSEEGAGNSRAFQLYDLLIMMVVALIGILIFRRIAITELQEGEPGEEHLHNENI
jgi:ubiquitin-conjugating enzyme E2 J1